MFLFLTGWWKPFVRHRRGKRSQHIRVGLAEERKGSQDHGDQGQSNYKLITININYDYPTLRLIAAFTADYLSYLFFSS